MPTKRMIHAEIWCSESVGRLTCEQRLLFIGLFSNADDQGRLPGHPAAVRAMIFMYDDFTQEKIDGDLSVLSSGDFIIRYEVGGRSLIQVKNWWTYQTPQWAYPSSYPPPDGWHDCIRGKKSNKVYTENWPPPQWDHKQDDDPEGEDSGDDAGDSSGERTPERTGERSGERTGEGDSIDQNRFSDRGSLDYSGANAPHQQQPRTAASALVLELYGDSVFSDDDLATLVETEKRTGTVKVTEAIKWAHKKGIREMRPICTAAEGWIISKGNGHRSSTGPPGKGGTLMDQARVLLKELEGDGEQGRDSKNADGADGWVSEF